MCSKVSVVTFALVLFAYCNASTLPETVDTLSKPQDPETVPVPTADAKSSNFPETVNSLSELQDPATASLPSPDAKPTNVPETVDTLSEPQDPETVPVPDIKPTNVQQSGETTNQQSEVQVQSDQLAPCGGGCVTSSQCAAYAGTTNCRCAWFGCNLYTAEADLTDVQQFDIFIKAYSGNTAMLTSAEKAYRRNTEKGTRPT